MNAISGRRYGDLVRQAVEKPFLRFANKRRPSGTTADPSASRQDDSGGLRRGRMTEPDRTASHPGARSEEPPQMLGFAQHDKVLFET